jgi:3-isopropylmalate/(R)-2-methylmalate dehydratase small subunit
VKLLVITFWDWRYGTILQADFVLNDATYSENSCWRNFGSGSSREHAAWAVYDYGFRAVVSSSLLTFFRKLFEYWRFTCSSKPRFADAIFKAIEADPKTT